MCKDGKVGVVIMATILSVVLSLMLYFNIIVTKQLGQEVDNLTKYVQNFVNKPAINVDFARLQRANVLIINGAAAGSGTVITMEDGYIYILTARHVAESQNVEDVLEIEVPMIDKNYRDANKRHMNRAGCQYVVVDKTKDVVLCETDDMALMRVKDFAAHELSYVVLSKEDPKVGDTIYTIGNPLCNIDIIARGLFTGIETRDGMSAALLYGGITYGNSGGAVVNDRGELIGVVFAKAMSFPVSHIGVSTLRKPMITFVGAAFETFEKEDSRITK